MTMRRFGSRWRDATTPNEVLDIFKVEGRYEILFRNWNINDRKDEWADGLDVDAEGFRHPSFSLMPWEASRYRYRNGHKRQSWASLPEAVKTAAIRWLTAD
jgi:hypothetical protein